MKVDLDKWGDSLAHGADLAPRPLMVASMCQRMAFKTSPFSSTNKKNCHILRTVDNDKVKDRAMRRNLLCIKEMFDYLKPANSRMVVRVSDRSGLYL